LDELKTRSHQNNNCSLIELKRGQRLNCPATRWGSLSLKLLDYTRTV